MFKNGTIHDVLLKDLVRHHDSRGWLTEIYRADETEERYRPVMEYISMTEPGVTRGPHEHVDQADYFAFIGPSTFKVYLWDARKDSPTYLTRQVITAGEDAPRVVIIPAGVVHAYKNIGKAPGMVVNLPNRLYAGWGKKEKVDETRHEDVQKSPFIID
jgi:dTDP-4-dehydrorhamnose 3,5-epimerase